ncbi:hypothetical protein [Clostridium aciditolerans]|uniref:hypothetical protein n=1 Tax=Clostridium aciditolerans TaxID=339861 RepID=UPI001B3CA148|nr:hypothetical protein [Clostridium aciditolerans]
MVGNRNLNTYQRSTTDRLEYEIEYCQKLVTVIEKERTLTDFTKVKEKLNLLNEKGSSVIRRPFFTSICLPPLRH